LRCEARPAFQGKSARISTVLSAKARAESNSTMVRVCGKKRCATDKELQYVTKCQHSSPRGRDRPCGQHGPSLVTVSGQDRPHHSGPKAHTEQVLPASTPAPHLTDSSSRCCRRPDAQYQLYGRGHRKRRRGRRGVPRPARRRSAAIGAGWSYCPTGG